MNGIVYVYGNRKTCSLCRKLAPLVDGAAFKAEMTKLGLEIVQADRTDNASTYASVKSKYKVSGDWPKLVVVDAQKKLLGMFVARSTTVKPFTVPGIVAKVKALCPACADPCPGDDCAEPRVCPTCGQTILAK